MKLTVSKWGTSFRHIRIHDEVYQAALKAALQQKTRVSTLLSGVCEAAALVMDEKKEPYAEDPLVALYLPRKGFDARLGKPAKQIKLVSPPQTWFKIRQQAKRDLAAVGLAEPDRFEEICECPQFEQEMQPEYPSIRNYQRKLRKREQLLITAAIVAYCKMQNLL